MSGDTEELIAELTNETFSAFVISCGKPCTCGPGFCWNEAGVGGYGVPCRKDKDVERRELPDCPHCGAQHQGTDTNGRALCWHCAEHPEAPYRLQDSPLLPERRDYQILKALIEGPAASFRIGQRLRSFQPKGAHLWTIRTHGELRALKSRGYIESFNAKDHARTFQMFRLTDKGRKQLMAHMERVRWEVSAKKHFEGR